MSNIIRQENLFAAEDFTKIYKSFQDVSFKSYDFDELKTTLVNYIRAHFPEDFNDFVESSEFIAIIELLAFLGTSLAFRVDLNSRENILDTAQRRESIIRLARMINYRPKRNIAATGLFKLQSIQTDQLLADSVGKSLNDVPITWADPNNPDWFDQFITVLNAVFRPVNPFGHPSKSAIIGGVPTDLYELNNVLGVNVAHPISISVNGEEIPFDIVNPDIDVSIEEKHPDQNEPFSVIYRNDSQGISSSGTGFFLKFKQGELQKEDFRFDFPTPNRVQEVNATNVNETDVYVQEVNDAGTVQEKWEKVPAVSGNNIIFNSIAHDQRNIFEVIPGNDNTISIKFADGNFGNIPTGIMRVWHRTSVNRTLIIRPEDVRTQTITFRYVGTDGNLYTFTLNFGLEVVVANGSATESNEDIKLRAPQVFYTQQRMVNNEDYNVLPLAFGNQILKARATNRTHAGHSRYIDINDPTGFHENLILYGDDGALFKERILRREFHTFSEILSQTAAVLLTRMEIFLPSPSLRNFFFSTYIPEVTGVYGDEFLEVEPGDFFWKTSPDIFKNDTGFFTNKADDPYGIVISGIFQNAKLPPYVTDGAVVTLYDPADPLNTKSTSVKSLIRAGNPIDPTITTEGPIVLGSEIANLWSVGSVLPNFRTVLRQPEKEDIQDEFDAKRTFGIGYDLNSDEWYVIRDETISAADIFELENDGLDDVDITKKNSWILAAIYSPTGGETYEFISRGTSYIFETLRSVRFYFDAEQRDLNLTTGQSVSDTIEILPTINNDKDHIPLDRSIIWTIHDAVIQDDGFRDPSKVEIIPADLDEDNTADVPTAFEKLVGPEDEVIFRKFVDDDGYEKTRIWVTDWVNGDNAGADYLLLDISSTVSQTISEMGFMYVREVGILDLDSRILITANPGVANNITIKIVDGGSSGTAVASFLVNTLTITIEDGVTTEDTIAAAIETDTTHISSAVADSAATWILAVGDDEGDIVWEYDTFPLTAGDIFVIKNAEVLDSISLADIAVPDSFGLTKQFTNNLDPLSPGSSPNLISNTNKFLQAMADKTFLIADAVPATPNRFRTLLTEFTEAAGHQVSSITDEFHLSKNGRSFTQDSSVARNLQEKLHFKWNHIAPADHRIDPSVSNIIDIIVLNNTYYTEVLIWKDEKKDRTMFPIPPTTSELRTEYAELDKFKTISDQIIYSPGIFKLLFGPQADEELQAKFVAVKIPSAAISDSELKTKIIQSIDIYFDIKNWDFGERFFYTELSAFIHTNLSKFLGSVVIVPRKGESKFGNLFEITSGSNELFLSTATVADIEIVRNFTGTQLKI